MRILKQWSVPMLRRRPVGGRQPLVSEGRRRWRHRSTFRSRKSWAGISVLTSLAFFTGCDREESGLRVPRTTPELGTLAPGADAPTTRPEVATATSSLTPQTRADLGGGGDTAGSHACSVLGMVSASPRSDSGFDIKRKDVSAVIHALREQAHSGGKAQLLAPATTKEGKAALRMIGVGLHSECGIRSEDVIVALNGIPVADRGLLAENKEKLTTTPELVLELERSGQKRQITYYVAE
jgi:hypothetical protein